VAAAAEAEKISVEKGIDAWKKVVAAAPQAWAPRRELARVYKKAERWNAFIEVMKGRRRQGELGRRPRTRSPSSSR
jgi:pyruvate dehydrogenase complex dehydrogenase (E1) component